MATKPLNIRLDEELDRRLEALAARNGRTKAFYAGEAIEEFLDACEEHFLVKDALAEFRESRDDAISVDDVDFGSLGE